MLSSNIDHARQRPSRPGAALIIGHRPHAAPAATGRRHPRSHLGLGSWDSNDARLHGAEELWRDAGEAVAVAVAVAVEGVLPGSDEYSLLVASSCLQVNTAAHPGTASSHESCFIGSLLVGS